MPQEYKFCPMCRAELIRAERGGTLRQVCGSCDFVAWNNPIPIAGAIVERQGCVVLVRSRGWAEGRYGLVAGFIEAGETPRAAALREVREEVGVHATEAELVGTYPFPERNQLIFTYHIDAREQPIVLCEKELIDYRAVPIPEVVPWTRGTGPALRDWLASRGHEREPVDFGRHMPEPKEN